MFQEVWTLMIVLVVVVVAVNLLLALLRHHHVELPRRELVQAQLAELPLRKAALEAQTARQTAVPADELNAAPHSRLRRSGPSAAEPAMPDRDWDQLLLFTDQQ